MSFVEPLFLIGLLAAALPIVVHLINRRKAVRQPFPAMKFLMQSNRREARGIKVRQWALMALRILVIALLAFSLAKPFVLSSSGVTASERLPTAVVYVVDTSYSMANDDWWENARDAFEAQTDRLRPWDEIALVTTNPADPTAHGVARLTGTHSQVLDAFDELKPTAETTDLPGALDAAGEILSTSQLPNRRIVVISDFAHGTFPDHAAPDEPVGYDVDRISVRGSAPDHPADLGVVSVDYEQEGSSREQTWRIDATVRNFGPERVDKAELRLKIDGSTVAAGYVSVDAGKSVTHTFRHTIEGSGVKSGVVELADPDDLAVDDSRHFAIRLKSKIKTLLVNGEPSSVIYRDEMFFFERALNPRSDSSSNIVPELTTREGLERIDLTDYDVVVLSNVSRITPTAAKKLHDFVDGGGGLFVTMGDQVDVNAYNHQLGDLLPKHLRGLKQLAEIGDPDAPLKITHFGTARRQHPIFHVFEMPGGGSLQGVQVYSYMLLEPSPPEQSTTLLSYKDAAPALLERRVGRGRVLLLTTTVDDEWTDLPFRPAFLPLARRSVQYLARRATSEGKAKHVVGEKVEMEVASLVRERVVFRTPQGGRIVREPVDGKVSITPKTPGVYEVWADDTDDPGNRIDNLSFAVNLDTAESDLTALGEDALAPWTNRSAEAREERAGGATAQKRVNLWPYFLFCITLFLLAETVLGTRKSVLARLWRKLTGKPEPGLDDETN